MGAKLLRVILSPIANRQILHTHTTSHTRYINPAAQLIGNEGQYESDPRLIEFWSIQSSLGEPGALQYVLGVSRPPSPKDIPEPSHGRVFREKFRSVYVVKGV